MTTKTKHKAKSAIRKKLLQMKGDSIYRRWYVRYQHDQRDEYTGWGSWARVMTVFEELVNEGLAKRHGSPWRTTGYTILTDEESAKLKAKWAEADALAARQSAAFEKFKKLFGQPDEHDSDDDFFVSEGTGYGLDLTLEAAEKLLKMLDKEDE